MSYVIDANLDTGVPKLRVLEAESGTVRLVFSGPTIQTCSACTCACPEQCPNRIALKRLFRELFLLSCGDWMGLKTRLQTSGSEFRRKTANAGQRRGKFRPIPSG